MAREDDGSCVGNRLQINIQLHGGRQLGLKKTAENDTAERLGYQHLVLVSGGVCFIETFQSCKAGMKHQLWFAVSHQGCCTEMLR